MMFSMVPPLSSFIPAWSLWLPLDIITPELTRVFMLPLATNTPEELPLIVPKLLKLFIVPPDKLTPWLPLINPLLLKVCISTPLTILTPFPLLLWIVSLLLKVLITTLLK